MNKDYKQVFLDIENDYLAKKRTGGISLEELAKRVHLLASSYGLSTEDIKFGGNLLPENLTLPEKPPPAPPPPIYDKLGRLIVYPEDNE